ncbi:MAG TPA: hypothetical protein VEK08_04595 [Planctomycetota bacterium]|nr:hypothetical protein [Planctomycetota bacterium]
MFKKISFFAVLFSLLCASLSAGQPKRGQLDPRGTVHIPIGIPNTLDTLKTFVEAEGNFSPGVGSYGIYFWIYDHDANTFTAPTMDGVKSEHGLSGTGVLIPWTTWSAGDIAVRTEVCHVLKALPPTGIPGGPVGVHVAGARARMMNRGNKPKKFSLFVALRPLGAAGWQVKKLEVSPEGDTLLVDGRTAVAASRKPDAVGVLPLDNIGEAASAGNVPEAKSAESPNGECSGAMKFTFALLPTQEATLDIVCPVLPGRNAVRHQWDGKSAWAQFDEAVPNSDNSGQRQPDAGLNYYRNLKVESMLNDAAEYWQDFTGRVKIRLPDPRWAECFAATLGHVALAMNEGAPDVAVVNYNVYNRDGVYVANMLQKAGQNELADQCIRYFASHPFNGRVQPEADNPGQILWIIGQHWLFTRDEAWLPLAYGTAKQLVKMIAYYRTTPGPHWVNARSMKFGDDLPKEQRQELKPGACDGFHPEYTEAFDIAGLRAAILLGEALKETKDVEEFRALEKQLFEKYDARFGANLKKEYGSYSVLWPCQLYPYSEGKAWEQFKSIGAQKPTSWRYFPPATAHQGLLAGNREAGHGTLALHLDHEQMKGWYAFDEGGKSGSGGWKHLKTTWNGDIAMPHGWAIAEVNLLLRDSLAFEDKTRLVLLAGVPPDWFKKPEGMSVEKMPTHFGLCSFKYVPNDKGATLTLSGKAEPADGFILRLPKELNAKAKAGDKELARAENGDFVIPTNTEKVELEWVK